MSPYFFTYFLLQEAVETMDPKNEAIADDIRDVMDRVWRELTPEEHLQIDAGTRPVEFIRLPPIEE